MNAEIIENMPEDQYHQETGVGECLWLTRSAICCYTADPSLFKLRYIDKHPCAQVGSSDPMRFGSFFEAHILDDDISNWTLRPDTYTSKTKLTKKETTQAGWQDNVPDDCSLMPDGFFYRSEVKTWNGNAGECRKFMQQNANIYTQDDLDKSNYLFLRFNETAIGTWWLNQVPESRKQLVVRWHDEGLPLQVRIDCEMADTFLCDLKSTASPIEKFNYTALKYGYHTQAAMYSDGYELATGKKLPYVFAIGETGGLQRARIRSLPDHLVKRGRLEYKLALRGIKANDYTAIDATETNVRHEPLTSWQEGELEDIIANMERELGEGN